jgi:outer membrane protein TolC
MKIRCIYGLLICIPLVDLSSQTITLNDCQKFARENHPYNKDKERIIQNNDLKIKNIGTQWFPQLNINGQATYQSDAMQLSMPVPSPSGGFMTKNIETAKDQYKVTFDANQLLYDGGMVKAQKSVTESTEKAELLQNDADLNKVTEQLNQVYFTLLVYKKNIKMMQSMRQTLLERQKIIESGFKNGVLQQSDVDNINIELLKSQQQIAELELGYSSFIKVLNEITGQEYKDSIALEIPIAEISDTLAFSKPELKMLEAQQDALANTDKVSKSNRLPKLYAFSTAGYGRPGLNMLSTDFEPFYMIGITLKWNIWDWNKTSRDRQSLAIQRDMLSSKRQALDRNLKITAENSHSRIKQLESALETDSAIVALRKTVTERSANKLDQGVITSSDYINDLNAETQARIQFEVHKIQLVQEKVNYLTIKGIY